MKLEITTEAFKLSIGGAQPSHQRRWTFTMPDGPYRAATRLVLGRLLRENRRLREKLVAAENERDRVHPVTIWERSVR